MHYAPVEHMMFVLFFMFEMSVTNITAHSAVHSRCITLSHDSGKKTEILRATGLNSWSYSSESQCHQSKNCLGCNLKIFILFLSQLVRKSTLWNDDIVVCNNLVLRNVTL